jgi:hypothetical protein
MATKLSAAQYLDREYLEIRCRLLDVAAALDRVGGAAGADSARGDARYAKLVEAAQLLTDGKPNRAERLQRLFSDAYDSNWRT